MQECLERDRAKKLAEPISSFEKVHQDLLDDDFQEFFNDLESPRDWTRECTTWEALPQQFVDWIQAQEGLRLNGEPISNRDMLEIASQLLHWRGNNKSFHSSTSPITVLAVNVALQYINGITRTGSGLMQDCTIPGSADQVIQREFFTCKKPPLSDAFPRFHKDMPGAYVIIVHERSNCGRLDCNGKNSALTPIDPRQKYTRLRTRALEASVRAKGETSLIAALLRSGSDLKDCTEEVLVQCPNKECGYERTYCGRWTIHDPPKFLQPHLKCSACKHGTAYFRAVDAKIPTVTEAALYDVLQRFRNIGCNLMEFPKVPEIIFSTKLSYKERFELLKKAKDPSHDIKTTRKAPRKRKHDLT
jgi:hypothetical protein